MEFYEAMNEVLQTSRYNGLTGRGVNFGQIIGDAVGGLINRIFDGLSFVFPESADMDTSAFAAVFTAAGIVMAAASVGILIQTFLLRKKDKVLYSDDIYAGFDELRKYTVAELLTKSENAENRRLSVRFRYIAALIALDERGTVRVEPSATNALIHRQIKYSAPVLEPPFSRAIDIFHRAWFGHKNISDEAFFDFAGAVDILVRGEHHEAR